MEFNDKEVKAVSGVTEQVEAVCELNDLQLALVGGGIGETTL